MSADSKKIDVSDVLITHAPRTPVLTEEFRGRMEEIVFTAFYRGDDVGHLTADRWIRPTSEQSRDVFYVDTSVRPSRPIPLAFYFVVRDDLQRNGIASALLVAANAYYKANHQVPLHSTTNNPQPTKENGYYGSLPVWEALVRRGLAEEIGYRGLRRWRML